MIKISPAYLFVLYHKTSLIDVAYLITKGSEDEPDKILRYINGIRNCALKKVIKPVLSNLHAHVLTEKVWDGPPIEVHHFYNYLEGCSITSNQEAVIFWEKGVKVLIQGGKYKNRNGVINNVTTKMAQLHEYSARSINNFVLKKPFSITCRYCLALVDVFKTH